LNHLFNTPKSVSIEIKRIRLLRHRINLNIRTTAVVTFILALSLFTTTANSAGNIESAFRVTTQQKVNSAHTKNTLLVKFKKGSSVSRVKSILTLNKGKQSKARSIRGVKRVSLSAVGSKRIVAENQWQTITYPDGTDLATVIDKLSKVAEVAYVQPDYIYTMSTGPAVTPDDPLYPVGDSNNTTIQNLDLLWGIKRAKADHAWRTQTGKFVIDNATGFKTGIVVAVIDSGIDKNHPDLKNNLWRNPKPNALDVHGIDYADNDNDPNDDDGHGTHVAGTIGAEGNNGIGVTGMAWDVSIMSVKVFNRFGGAPSTRMIDAIDYASANGAVIINNSWGGPYYDQALYDAIQRSPALFIFSAGNHGSNSDLGDAPPYMGVTAYPAAFDLPNIISVAWSSPTDKLNRGSNFGMTSVDIAAPGDFIWSTATSDPVCRLCPSTVFPGYMRLQGTSMAAPHVSGAAVLLYSQYANMTPAKAKALLLQSADAFENEPSKLLTTQVLTGVLNIDQALHSPFLLTSDATIKTMLTPGVVQFTVTAASFEGGSGSLSLSLASKNISVTGSLSKQTLSVPANGQDSVVVSLSLATGYPYQKLKSVLFATDGFGQVYNISLVINATVDSDLVVTSIATNPLNVKVNSGDYIDMVTTIQNQGTVDVTKSFFVRYYFSEDGLISRWATGFLGDTTFASLVAGESKTFTTRVIVPTLSGGRTVADGNVLVGAIVDINLTVPETNETNNVMEAANPLTIADESDLIVISMTTAASNIQPGDSIDVTTTIKNIGDTGGNNACWHAYLSKDATPIDRAIDVGINSLGPTCTPGTNSYLAPGATYTRTSTVKI